MTVEQQDYEHLSRILDSYVLRNDERHRRFVKYAGITIPAWLHEQLNR